MYEIKALEAASELLTTSLPSNYGFALLIFEEGGGKYYLSSNVDRSQGIELLQEFIRQLQAKGKDKVQ